MNEKDTEQFTILEPQRLMHHLGWRSSGRRSPWTTIVTSILILLQGSVGDNGAGGPSANPVVVSRPSFTF